MHTILFICHKSTCRRKACMEKLFAETTSQTQLFQNTHTHTHTHTTPVRRSVHPMLSVGASSTPTPTTRRTPALRPWTKTTPRWSPTMTRRRARKLPWQEPPAWFRAWRPQTLLICGKAPSVAAAFPAWARTLLTPLSCTLSSKNKRFVGWLVGWMNDWVGVRATLDLFTLGPHNIGVAFSEPQFTPMGDCMCSGLRGQRHVRLQQKIRGAVVKTGRDRHTRDHRCGMTDFIF